jgi:hypothetical protein
VPLKKHSKLLINIYLQLRGILELKLTMRGTPVQSQLFRRVNHWVPTPPLPLHVVKAGRNHLNEEITPLLPNGIGERYMAKQ